jgi:hypothetical protein
MRIAIPDDYQDCVRGLDCFSKLDGHDTRIFNDTVKGTDALAERFADAHAIVLTRERTRIDAALLDRLPSCASSARPASSRATSTWRPAPRAACWWPKAAAPGRPRRS